MSMSLLPCRERFAVQRAPSRQALNAKLRRCVITIQATSAGEANPAERGTSCLHKNCPRGDGRLAAGALAAVAIFHGLLVPGSACALDIHMEPGNALSLPTWAIHVSSVLEWVTAMGLMWKYAEATGNPRWKGMAWGMLPSLGSAMAACTWHFFYNSPDLEFLVVIQSALTVIGNCTCWWAAYRIYEAAMAEKSSA